MSRLRAFLYCCISFVCGMLVLYAAVNLAFAWGSITRGALVVADERDFWSAIEAKVPYDRNGYRFVPHSHEKQIQVTKRTRR